MVQEQLIKMVSTARLQQDFKENTMKKVPVPMEIDSSEFYNNDVSNHDGAHFDGNQKNGRHGSPVLKTTPGNTNNPDYGGINFNNNHDGINNASDSDMSWEKKQGVFVDPSKKFTDIHDKMYYEVDLSKKIKCVGMPDESITGNSSDCGYGS